MINLGLPLTPVKYAANLDAHLESAHRLIVLVPPDVEYSTATKRIRELAQTTGMHIQLLGLCKDAAEEMGSRRALIAMASLLQDGQICAEVKIDIGTNWREAVKTTYKNGDVIVCFAEQRIGLLQRPLSQILESNFKATVYILSNLSPQKSKPNTLAQVSAWLGFIGMIVGFGILQGKMVQLPEGWLQNVLLILSIIPELWLISVWNRLFG